MSFTGSRGGAGAAAVVVEIPASTKKIVQDLKEVVGNSEEEIYAMLKECNMDPNETAQRLLNQDPFHEVKRKRDKKKESGGFREATDVRGRPGSGGSYGRGGGRGGGGRGSSLPRFGSQEHGLGRGRSSGRENGIHLSARGSSAVSNSSPAIGVAKQSAAAPTSVPSSAPAQSAAAPQAQGPSSGSGSTPGVANESSGYIRPAPQPQGAWASGQGTMADILKARATPPPTFQAPSAPPAFPSAQPAVSTSYPAAASSVQPSDAPDFYSSSADPVLYSSVESRGGGAQGAIGAIGSSTLNLETRLGSDVVSAQFPSFEPSADETRDVESEVEVPVQRLPSPSPVFSPVASQETSGEEAIASTEGQQQSEELSALGGSQFNGRLLYATPQQPVGTQKAASGVGLEWKAKAPGQSSVGVPSDGGLQSVGAVDPTMLVQSYQALSLQEDEPVIIPTHFRVPEADRSHLSFGSFGTDFNTGFGTSFGLEEVEKPKHVEASAAEEAPVEQAAPASVETQVELGQSYGHQPGSGSGSVENVGGGVEALSVGHPAPVAAAQEQQSKADAVVQQSPGYFLGASNYPGFGLMPQMPGGQYGYEQAESQAQDMSRLPSMVVARLRPDDELLHFGVPRGRGGPAVSSVRSDKREQQVQREHRADDGSVVAAVSGGSESDDRVVGRQRGTEFASGEQRAERTGDAATGSADALHAAALGAVRRELHGVPVHAAELPVPAASVSAPRVQLEQQHVRSAATGGVELPPDGGIELSSDGGIVVSERGGDGGEVPDAAVQAGGGGGERASLGTRDRVRRVRGDAVGVRVESGGDDGQRVRVRGREHVALQGQHFVHPEPAARRQFGDVDPDGDAAGDGAVRGHADELVLQLGEPGAAQRVRAIAPADARARAPERGVREPVSPVAGSASGEPPDAAAAAAGHGRGSGEHARRGVPAATATDAADVEQLELLARGWANGDMRRKRCSCGGCWRKLEERHLMGAERCGGSASRLFAGGVVVD